MFLKRKIMFIIKFKDGTEAKVYKIIPTKKYKAICFRVAKLKAQYCQLKKIDKIVRLFE